MSLDDLAPSERDGDLRIDLFDRYCAGDASAQEQAMIEAWMAQHPESRGWYTRVRDGLSAGDFTEVAESDVRRHVEAVLWRVREGVPHRRETFGQRLSAARFVLRDRGRWAAWPVMVAAVIAGMVWLGGGVTGRHLGGQATPMLTYTTGNGQRATITLPDGNTAVLDVASQLDVPADYLAGNHIVRLRGEALFTISAHAQGRTPFAVTTGTTVAQVLGTRFLVRHYATDTATLVSVREGKVSVRALGATRGPTMVLAAARQATVLTSGRTQVGVADSAQFSFATGVLTLTGGLFVEAIPALDRWYDADIRVKDPALATRRLTGEYAAGSLADLAGILEMTFDVRVVRAGRVLTLYPR